MNIGCVYCVYHVPLYSQKYCKFFIHITNNCVPTWILSIHCSSSLYDAVYSGDKKRHFHCNCIHFEFEGKYCVRKTNRLYGYIYGTRNDRSIMHKHIFDEFVETERAKCWTSNNIHNTLPREPHHTVGRYPIMWKMVKCLKRTFAINLTITTSSSRNTSTKRFQESFVKIQQQ